MRINDAMTYDIAKGHVVQYVGMTADGSEVYFTTSEPLTTADNDTSTDLYPWSEETNALTLVSVGKAVRPATQTNVLRWTEQCGSLCPFVNRYYSQTYQLRRVDCMEPVYPTTHRFGERRYLFFLS